MRETDIDIHNIKNEHTTENSPTKIGGTTGYTKGLKEIDIDDDSCYAKHMELPNDIRKYYVKMGVSGHIFDPWGMFSEGMEAKTAKHLGKKAWSFHQVGEACYKHYLRYLSTRVKSHYNLAQREARHG